VIKKYIVLSFLFAFIAVSASYAARPLATEDSGIVGVGEWEVETGIESETDKTSTLTDSLGISVKTGINDDFDFGADTAYQSSGGTSSMGNSSIKAKYRFTEDDGGSPGLAVGGAITFPSGGGDNEISVTGILSKSLENIMLHLNISLSSAGSVSTTGYSGALEYLINESVTIVGEIVGASASGASQLDALIGGRMGIADNMTVDVGLNINMSDNSPASKYTFGLTTIL